MILFEGNPIDYNVLREMIWKVMKERFLDVVIEKGLKNDYHKKLLQNNINDFYKFFRIKIRNEVDSLIKDGTIQLKFKQSYNKLVSSYKQKLLDNGFKINNDSTINNFEQLNVELKNQIHKEYSRIIVETILSSNEIKQKLLNYFDEFITFLVIF